MKLRYRWHPWALLAVSLSLTAYSSFVVYQNAELAAGSRFAAITGEIRTKIAERIQSYQQVLRGGAGLFAASDRVTREEWRRYVQQLHLEAGFLGIQGVGFTVHLTPEEVTEHEHAVRREGFPGYRVWPEGMRDEYSAIVFLEPFSGRNLRAFGYDMLSEPIRRAAMHAARDAGSIAASGKVTLVQETDEDVQAGFLIYLPLYRQGQPADTPEQRRQALEGWIYAPFRMRDLLTGILGSEQNTVHLHIYDGEQADADNLLFDSHPPGEPEQASPFTAAQHIDVGSHVWTLEFRAIPVFLGRVFDYSKALMVALGGSVTSVLLFAIAHSLVMTNRRARAIAERLTDSLRKSREFHHRLVTLAHEGVIAMDADGAVTYVNARMAEMLGYDPDEMLGKSFLSFMEAGKHEHVRQKLESRRHGISETYELDMLGKGGERVCTLVSAAPLMDAGGVFQGSFAMVTDITGRKQAEARILRLSGLYHALSRINEAITHSTRREELFREACGIAVEAAGFRMAWIGLIDPQTQEVEPVAFHGTSESYIARLRVSADPSVPEGQGPVGKAIREGEPQVFNDFQREPGSLPWHDAAKAAGFFAAAAFALKEHGRSIGAMAFYSEQRGFFDEEQIDLLGRMAENISFALDNFRHEAERRRAEMALRESEERYWGIFDAEQDPIFLYEQDSGGVIDANQAAVKLYGYNLEELKNIGIAALVAPSLPADAEESGTDRRILVRSHRKKGGETFPVEITHSHFVLGQRLVTIAVVRDITERMRAEAALKESEARFRRAVAEAPIPIMLHAEDGEVILLNRPWEDLTGYAKADIPTIGAWVEKAYGDRPGEPEKALGEIRAICDLEETRADGEYTIRVRGGQRAIWDFRSSRLGAMPDGRRLVITMAMDVTDRRAIEEKIRYLAHHDPLTGLPNRFLLQDRIEQALALAHRSGGRLALLYFDLDHFKEVNDTLGHAVGDGLLVSAAQRLKGCVRESDTIGRLGGDEFLALLVEIGNQHQAAVVAEKIRAAMAQPFDVSGHELYVSSSIGIALFPRDGQDVASLLKSADVAMYRAKRGGRNRFCFFSETAGEP